MKKLVIILIPILLNLEIYSQEITGSWYGTLEVQGTQLKIVFHVSEENGELSCKMDSPDQGAYGIPMDYCTFSESQFITGFKAQMMEYTGIFHSKTITGTFNQAGMKLPLNLSPEEKTKVQEPLEPFPYDSSDIEFNSIQENIILAGTLTIPEGEGPFPAVVLVSGSGPQNRNEEILGHKPFLVLAHHLTEKGIAVLRYDDRGVGKSGGSFAGSTSLEFKDDALGAVKYLRNHSKINGKHVGIIGHSEGGIIAPLAASEDASIAFIVMLAGPGINGGDILLEQSALISEASGEASEEIEENRRINQKAFQILRENRAHENLKSIITDYYLTEYANSKHIKIPEGFTMESFVESLVTQLTDPWFSYFLNYEPALALQKLSCPVLAVNGEKDLQVPSKVNLDAIESALQKGGNQNYTTKEFENLNHLFQTCESGSPSEYGDLEETFSPEVLIYISNWIISQ